MCPPPFFFSTNHTSLRETRPENLPSMEEQQWGSEGGGGRLVEGYLGKGVKERVEGGYRRLRRCLLYGSRLDRKKKKPLNFDNISSIISTPLLSFGYHNSKITFQYHFHTVRFDLNIWRACSSSSLIRLFLVRSFPLRGTDLRLGPLLGPRAPDNFIRA